MTALSKKQSEFDALEDRAEWIDGIKVYKALPGADHSAVEGGILRSVGHFFHRKQKSDGVGGWWIMPEISIQYKNISEKGRILTADIAGWKREKLPSRPQGYPVKVTPDWVCEVCHTTRKKDTTIVPETLAAEGVEWFWFVDVEESLLTIYHLENQRYSVIKTVGKEAGMMTLPPFEGVALSLPVLLGDEPEDDV